VTLSAPDGQLSRKAITRFDRWSMNVPAILR
jgi:hypothetical protein